MFIKLIRLGKDAELKTLQGGKQVLNFSGAYSVGYKDNEKTQWIECAIWGDRAAIVQQYMVKGAQIVIYGEDLEVEAWNKNDSERTAGATLKCTVRNFDFAGGKPDGSAYTAVPLATAMAAPSAPAPAPIATPAAPQAPVMTRQDILTRFQGLNGQEAIDDFWCKLSVYQQSELSADLA